MASKLFSLPLHQMRRNFGKCPNLRERLLMKRPFVWWGPICEGRSSGVGTRRPSKTQPRNCYCSQARWAKEFHCYQLKRAKQFKLHRNQILNMIWYRVASPTVQRCKVNCFVLFLQLGGWTIYYFYIQTNCTVLWNVGWIYNGAEKHCTFVIHFAGHGSGMAGVASIHPPEGHSLFSTY